VIDLRRRPRLMATALLAVVLLGMISRVHAAETQADSAAVPVTALHEALVAAMRGGAGLGCEGRRKLLQPVVTQAFDLPFLARQVVRRDWERFSDSERSAFERALTHFTVASYAVNFSAYQGEHFETLALLPLPRDQVKLRAQLIRPGHDSISFDYLLHQAGADWRIINVIAAGVSDLAIRSAQYQSLLQARGTAGLIAWVEQQTQTLRAECAAR